MKKISDFVPVIVFAKTPVEGAVKTRIAAKAGNRAALDIYIELLNHTARTVKNIRYHVAYTGDCRERLENIFSAAASFFLQTGDNLGDRMRNACKYMFSFGAESAIIIGCDCPYITPDSLNNAVSALTFGNDVVIGPANDGGYYLIGCIKKSLEVFDANDWGGPALFSQTMEIIRTGNLKTEMLPFLSDIDDMTGYRIWKESFYKSSIR
jgi:rSAM/selenodomain-associated transferase 1